MGRQNPSQAKLPQHVNEDSTLQNSMDVMKSEPGSCTDTRLKSSDDGNQVVGIKVEGLTSIKMEEDSEPVTSTVIKTEPANCVDILRDECGSCTETCSTSFGNGNQFLFVNVEDVTDIKEEEDEEPATSPVIETESMNCVDLLRSDPGSYSETCLRSSDFGHLSISTIFEDVTDVKEEKYQVPAIQTIKTEPENTVNEQLHAYNRKCAFSCDVCNKAFGRRPDLMRHKRRHSGERPFSCDVCNKAFSQGSSLITHKRIHSGERPFLCDVCNKAFGQQAHLMRHKRIHSGEQPFSCNLCNKAFSQKTDLIRHKQIHSGERPFSCNVCNKAFSLGSALITHQRIHSGERPFSCDVCNKAFGRQDHLKTHKRTHSGGWPF